MFRKFTLLCAGLLAAPAVMAQPAVFDDGTLHIFRGAVVSSGSVAYYRDIKLDLNDDGDFTVSSADEQVLAEINTVGVLMEPSTDYAEVMIDGWLSSSCKELDRPAVIMPNEEEEERVIHIVLAESQLDSGELCVQVVEPFSTTVELDLIDLEGGAYIIEVNGDEQAPLMLDLDRVAEARVDVNEDPNFTAPKSKAVKAPDSP